MPVPARTRLLLVAAEESSHVDRSAATNTGDRHTYERLMNFDACAAKAKLREANQFYREAKILTTILTNGANQSSHDNDLNDDLTTT